MIMSSGPRAVVDRPVIGIRKGGAADFARIAALAEAVYGTPRSVASVRWLYEANPAGACRLWLAEDAAGHIIALRPVFPWRFRVNGRDVLAAQAGDAMTHPAHRGNGLFSALVRACWTELHDDGVPFSFSFSNPGSLSVYRKITIGEGPRAGTHVVHQFQRLVCPLSVRAFGRRLPMPERVTRGVDVAYHAVLRRRWMQRRHLETFPVERFDDEFDELWTRTADRHGVSTVRDSRFLNWRFLEPPSGPYQVLGLRSRGRLAGYVAFETTAAGQGYIADLFGDPDPEIWEALLAASLRSMLDGGCVKVSLAAPLDSPLLGAIRAFGFVARPDVVPMAVHVYHDGASIDPVLRGSEWLAWFADRDVEHLAPAPFRR